MLMCMWRGAVNVTGDGAKGCAAGRVCTCECTWRVGLESRTLVGVVRGDNLVKGQGYVGGFWGHRRSGRGQGAAAAGRNVRLLGCVTFTSIMYLLVFFCYGNHRACFM